MSAGAAPAVVGALGTRPCATVDDAGVVRLDGARWELAWWVGADDRWRFPGPQSAARRRLVQGAPVVETRLSVPGGAAIHRVYGLGGDPGGLVVEVENASGGAFVLALVVRGRRGKRLRRGWDVGLDDARLDVGGETIVLPGRPRGRAEAATDDDLRSLVTRGDATVRNASGSGRRGPVAAALLYPVAHRTTRRMAVTRRLEPASTVDLAALGSAGDAARGWSVMLDRGMRLDVPDARVAEAVTASRAALLLRASCRRTISPEEVTALEDWGFDAEAAAAWTRLGARARRRAARRDHLGAQAWGSVRARLASASAVWTWPDGPAPLLIAVRDVLARDGGDEVAMLPGLPAEWLGQGVAVSDLPARAGPVSFALRWHGERPALLWEVPAGVRVTAPALDPSFASHDPAGEALLRAPTSRLLDLGARPDATPGTGVDDPGSFL